MEINLKQYQQIYLIPTGTTNQQYTKKILEIFNIDGNKHNIKEIKEIVENIHIPEIKDIKKLKVKIKGKTYRIVPDVMKATFNEWIQYESIVGISTEEYDIVKNLHKILSIYVRPEKKKFLFFKTITPLEEVDLDENEKMMLEMKIEDALAINVFFYHNAEVFMNGIRKHYLNEQILLIHQKAESTQNKSRISIKALVGIFSSWKSQIMIFLKWIKSYKWNFNR